MGHQAFGSSDQCGVIDCPMGERSRTIEIHMNSTHRGHWCYILKGNCMNKCFVIVSRRQVKVRALDCIHITGSCIFCHLIHEFQLTLPGSDSKFGSEGSVQMVIMGFFFGKTNGRFQPISVDFRHYEIRKLVLLQAEQSRCKP